MRSNSCFYALPVIISGLLVVTISFAPQFIAAKKHGRIGLETLYKELRNRSTDEVEWYVRHAYYVAVAENANLFNINGHESEECLRRSRKWQLDSFSDLEKIYEVWNELRTCSANVTSMIRENTEGVDADEEIILKNPAELFCQCMPPSNKPHNQYEYGQSYETDSKLRKYYFDRVPGSKWPEAMSGLYANLTSANLAELLILEALCGFNETGFFSDRKGYILFQIVRGLIYEDGETSQSIFNRALRDSAHDLVQAVAMVDKVSQRNKLISSIIPWMKNWIKDNMVRRFENHPTYKYQFVGRKEHLLDEMSNI